MIVLTSSIKNIRGMPFTVLILAFIHYRSPTKKLEQQTIAIFLGALTIQATSKESSETRMNVTTLKQVVFSTIFHVSAQPVQILARADPKMVKELKKFYNRECWLL